MQEETRDQRVYLKVKIKSLAEEARIIRREEQRSHKDTDKCGYSPTRTVLRGHRVTVVRPAARNALLVYGFIRGRKYRQIEPAPKTKPDWNEVKRLVSKYGPPSSFWSKLWGKDAIEKRVDKWATE